jgi:transcriptional regulator with XRE-family HTH domain
MTKLQALKKKFGAHVRAIREGKDMSLQDVASNCELDKSWIGKIERGQRTVTLNTIFELAKGLEVEPIKLLDFSH